MAWSKRSPVRFVVFLVLLALLVGYVVWKWPNLNEFGRRTAVNVPLLAQWGAEVVDDGPQATGGSPAAAEDIVPQPITRPATAAGGSEAFSLFSDGRLDRDRSRSQRLEVLQQLLAADELSADARSETEAELMALNRLMAHEADLENLLRARGFSDAVTFLYPAAGVVVVQAESLTQAQVAQVVDLVTRVAGTPVAGISVMARPR